MTRRISIKKLVVEFYAIRRYSIKIAIVINTSTVQIGTWSGEAWSGAVDKVWL
jgi:hypothetical protein